MRIRRPTPGMWLYAFLATAAAYRVATESGSAPPVYPRYEIHVAQVIDGDTIETADGIRVRLFGIDSPEIAHHGKPGDPWGEESTAWLKALVEGQTILLEESPVEKDRYGRTLGWLHLLDGTLVSEQSLKLGHSELLDRFGLPAQYESRLRAAEAEAKANARGLWKAKQAR